MELAYVFRTKEKKLYKEDKDNYAIKVISVFDRKS